MANNREKKKYGGEMTRLLSNCERKFPTIEDEKAHELVCAILEQAVYDWIGLDYGRLGYMVARNGNSLVYRAEVLSFLQSKWCEYLLSYAIPNFPFADFLKALKIEGPKRSAV